MVGFALIRERIYTQMQVMYKRSGGTNPRAEARAAFSVFGSRIALSSVQQGSTFVVLQVAFDDIAQVDEVDHFPTGVVWLRKKQLVLCQHEQPSRPHHPWLTRQQVRTRRTSVSRHPGYVCVYCRR